MFYFASHRSKGALPNSKAELGAPHPPPSSQPSWVSTRDRALPSPTIQREGRALQLVNHLSPNPSFTPVLEQGSHRSNFLRPQAPLVLDSSERGRFQAEQKNQFKPQQRTASNLMKIRDWKKEALSLLSISFSCREGAGWLKRPGSGGESRMGRLQ